MTWLTVKKVSELLDTTPRSIQKNIQNNLYEYRHVKGKGRGGIQYEVSLESLPQKAQDKYLKQQTEEYKPIMEYTKKQREEADKKVEIVLLYKKSKLSPDEFVKKFNNENPNNEISTSQLFRWQRKFKDSKDAADLIDKRGGYKRGQSSINDVVWEYFYTLYMTEQRRTVKACYDLTKKEFKYVDIPSVKTFQRRVKAIPEYAIVCYRYGEKAFNDSLPYMERDYTDIDSNDVWYSDHHLADVFVRDSNGKIDRPWITMWTDARSRKVMGYRVRLGNPNTDIVKDTLREAMQEFGVPVELYVDNGKDYKAKDGLNNEYPNSLVNRIGIKKTIYATKYHGQAKNIERFFRTFEERFGKMFHTYAGKDAKERPESLKNVPLEEYPTLQEYEESLKAYLNDYESTCHNGNGMDNKCPNQVYFENLKVKKEIKDHDALRMLCGRVVERVVLRNGINLFNNSYWNEALIYRLKEKVIVIYDPVNIDEINIFDIDGRAICKATPKIKTPFRNTTAEDYRKAQKERKAVKKAVKELAPTRDLQPWQIIARNQALEKNFEEEANYEKVNVLTPQMTENITILNSSSNKTNKNTDEENDIALSLYNYYTNN